MKNGPYKLGKELFRSKKSRILLVIRMLWPLTMLALIIGAGFLLATNFSHINDVNWVVPLLTALACKFTIAIRACSH